MGLVVLGEFIAIVGVLLEAKHAQPSCRLALVVLGAVVLVVVKVLVGQLCTLAEGVGTEGRAGASLSSDGLGGADGRDDILGTVVAVVAVRIGQVVVVSGR